MDIHGRKDIGIHLNRQISCIGDKAEKAGFDGMIVGWNDTYRVDIWKKVAI